MVHVKGCSIMPACTSPSNTPAIHQPGWLSGSMLLLQTCPKSKINPPALVAMHGGSACMCINYDGRTHTSSPLLVSLNKKICCLNHLPPKPRTEFYKTQTSLWVSCGLQRHSRASSLSSLSVDTHIVYFCFNSTSTLSSTQNSTPSCRLPSLPAEAWAWRRPASSANPSKR